MAPSPQSTILSILAAAREVEIFGIQFYSKVTNCVMDENGKAIMRSLGADERAHKETIEEVMDHLSPGLEIDGVVPEKELLDIIPKKVFPFPPEGTCLTVKDESGRWDRDRRGDGLGQVTRTPPRWWKTSG